VRKLHLLGNDVTLEIVDRDDARLQGSMGKLSHAQQWILLASMQTREQLESTALHELIEFANLQMHLDFSEHVVCCLETALYAMLSDNDVALSPLLTSHEGPSGEEGT